MSHPLLPLLLLCLPPLSFQDASVEPPASRQRESAIFDVRDLLSAGPQFPAPALGVPQPAGSTRPAQPGRAAEAPSGGGARMDTLGERFQAVAERERALQASADTLAELARAFLEPPLEPGQDLRIHGNGSFVFQGSRAQVEWLQAFLDRQRQGPEQVEVEAILLRLPAAAMERAGLVHGQTIAQPGALQRTVDALAALEGHERLAAPRLRIQERQRAALSVTEQLAYIQDWRLELVGAERSEIADPQIAVLQEGVALEVVAARLDARLHGLLVQVQHAEVEKPIAVKKVPLGTQGAEVEVHLPKVHRVQLQSALQLETGTSAVLLFHPDAERVLVAIVTLVSAEPR